MTTGLTSHDLTRVWLASRVRRLWEVASEDLPWACREFDRLVNEHGRIRMGRALSDAKLDEPIRTHTARGAPDIRQTAVGGASSVGLTVRCFQ
jgi:hypothetical protein